MGKKHLLYIHHPEFSNEPHKSKLVNQLLDAHYGDSKPVSKPGRVYTHPTKQTPEDVYTKPAGDTEPTRVIYTSNWGA